MDSSPEAPPGADVVYSTLTLSSNTSMNHGSVGSTFELIVKRVPELIVCPSLTLVNIPLGSFTTALPDPVQVNVKVPSSS